MPLDLVPPPHPSVRETIPMYPTMALDHDDEEEAATLARILPTNSEVRAILDDPEDTLAYIRKVQASLPDSDSALDSLVAVYEERVARLAKERAHAAAIVSQAHAEEEARAAREAAKAKGKAKARRKTAAPLDQMLVRLQPHAWKIVYSAICAWGLLQLALTR